jgi:hypothetical protein
MVKSVMKRKAVAKSIVKKATKMLSKKESKSCYKATTYAACGLWQADTKVKYNANPKSGKSFDRYAKYEKARTIEESLNLGSKPEDLLFDYEKGHLNILGPLRKAPLNPFKLKPADFSNLRDADRILIRYGCRHDPKAKKGGSEHIRNLETSLKECRKQCIHLRKLKVAHDLGLDDTKDLDERLDGAEYAKRSVADQEARDILREVEKTKRKVSEVEMLRALDQWGFARNPNRINVMQSGQEWVHSDTVGAIARRDGLILPQSATKKYPYMMKLLNRYIKDNLPHDVKGKFVYTSININKDYAGKRHRDAGNSGPSLLKSLGRFTGGRLNYFPDDNGAEAVEDLPAEKSLKLDPEKGIVFFDGNRAHGVDKFTGSRYSLVYFSCRRFWKMPTKAQALMKSWGFPYPSKQAIRDLNGMLEAPRGYGTAKKFKTSKEKTGLVKKSKMVGKQYPGYGFFPRTKEQEALESQARKFYKNKPLREVPEIALREKKNKADAPDWSPGNSIALGPSAKKLQHLELKGYPNNVDACDALNGKTSKIPKAILTAGYCVLYNNRKHVYYLVYKEDKKEAAMTAAGLGKRTLAEAKSAGHEKIKAARKAYYS